MEDLLTAVPIHPDPALTWSLAMNQDAENLVNELMSNDWSFAQIEEMMKTEVPAQGPVQPDLPHLTPDTQSSWSVVSDADPPHFVSDNSFSQSSTNASDRPHSVPDLISSASTPVGSGDPATPRYNFDPATAPFYPIAVPGDNPIPYPSSFSNVFTPILGSQSGVAWFNQHNFDANSTFTNYPSSSFSTHPGNYSQVAPQANRPQCFDNGSGYIGFPQMYGGLSANDYDTQDFSSVYHPDLHGSIIKEEPNFVDEYHFSGGEIHGSGDIAQGSSDARYFVAHHGLPDATAVAPQATLPAVIGDDAFGTPISHSPCERSTLSWKQRVEKLRANDIALRQINRSFRGVNPRFQGNVSTLPRNGLASDYPAAMGLPRLAELGVVTHPHSDGLKNIAPSSARIQPHKKPHGSKKRKNNSRNMGSEVSTLQTEGPKHDVRIRQPGWTTVNGEQSHPRQEPTFSTSEAAGKKRKRPSEAEGIKHSSSLSAQNPGPSQTGLGIALPQNGHPATTSTAVLSSPKNKTSLTQSQSNKSNGIATKAGIKAEANLKSKHAKANDDGSESEVDTDARGLLQMIAAASSDDEDESGISSSQAQAKPKPIQPAGSQGLRPPQAQQPIGMHYTIYSPHVQPSNYAPPKPAEEKFDPTAPLTAAEEAQLRDEGRFTKMEQSFLKDAIDEYCKKHHISVELANDFVCGKAREGNIPGDFWDEVCKSLPQRTKNSIQRAAKRVFRNHQKKGPWTVEEEQALAAAYHKAPDQWAKICEEVPGRSAEQCRDRWRNYTQNGAQLTRGPWTDGEEAQFIDICKTMLAQARADRERTRALGRVVATRFDAIDHLNFTAISTLMNGKRSRLHCRNKWHKLKKRPDVEAAIDAVMKGLSPPASAAAQPAQSNGTASPPGSQAPASAESSQPADQISSAASHTVASLLPPSARSAYMESQKSPAAGAQSTSSPAPHGLPAVSGPPASAFHTFRPSPVPAFNQGQGCISNPSQANPPPREPTASAPPPPTTNSRPPLPAPIPSAPAVPRSNQLPAILPPVSNAQHWTPMSSPPVAPPSWANAPPKVPQLFTPPLLYPRVGASTHARAIPGSKHMFADMPNDVSPEKYFGSNYMPGLLSMSSTTNTTRAEPNHNEATKLAPITSTQAPAPAYLKPLSPIVAALAKSAPPPASLPPPAAPLQDKTNGQIHTSVTGEARVNGLGQHQSTSPESTASPPASDGQADGRPVRKKQKTAKAQVQV